MTIEDLVRRIQSKVSGAEVFARDLTGEGNHFEAVVVADEFAGRSRVDRQRRVMEAFKTDWDGPLHALTIKTYTKEEWEKL